MKAIVVDDDVTSRLVLDEALSRFGKVDTCGNGTEAIRMCREALGHGAPYDVICMDVHMPGMSGIEALQSIREEEEGCGVLGRAKVIVITSSEDSGTIDEAFSQLCDAYIVKPIDTQAFLDVLECLRPVEGRSD
jgi:two-component system, chemotaxis family, chemotaxis protein CheY